jgi:hypothetical protein
MDCLKKIKRLQANDLSQCYSAFGKVIDSRPLAGGEFLPKTEAIVSTKPYQTEL